MDSTTLREQTGTNDLLHGRLGHVGDIHVNIRLHGKGKLDEQGRIVQGVDVMDCDAQGCWHVIEPPVDEDGNPVVMELRTWQTGLGDLRDAVLDHPGGIGHVIYRIGRKGRTYKDKRGQKKQAFEYEVTDSWDTAQRSLPPTSPVQTSAPGPAPPSGGGPNVTIPDGMHSAAPKEASNQGPISPAPAGAIPTPPAGEKAQQQAETGLCGCGREAVVVTFTNGPLAGMHCTRCGRRVA